MLLGVATARFVLVDAVAIVLPMDGLPRHWSLSTSNWLASTRMMIVCLLQSLMLQQTMLPRSLSSVVSCVVCLSLLRIASFSLSAGFPALFFVPAGLDVQPLLYSQQERELEDLVAFVETHRTEASPLEQRDEL